MATRLFLVTTLGALLVSPAFPQAPAPPGRVARLGYFAGTVSFQPAGIDDWTPAEVNHPVTTGDHIWTEADGIAELQTDNASVRIGGRTNFSYLNLNDTVTQIEVTTGTLEVRVHTMAPGEGFEIDTPQLAFNISRNGEYRVNVTEAGDATVVMVRSGNADINVGEQATPVAMGSQVRVSGGDNPVLDAPEGLPPADQFDSFCAQRDQRELMAQTAHFISRDLPGYADLDEGGIWRVVAPYGATWFPTNLAPDWAPYRYGHWLSTPMWGWTWVDDTAWGWTPFHYGRWVNVAGAWGWVPAMPVTILRPVYAPALVVFTDFDPGVVVTDGVVGWFPLAFGEVYVPPFAVGVAGLAAFNVGISIGGGGGAVDVAHGHYANREHMTAMRHGDFEHGRALHGDHMRVPHDRMERGHMRADAGRRPTREAMRGPRGDARGHVPPHGVANRNVMAKRSVPGHPGNVREARNMGHGPAAGARGPAANHGPAGSRGPMAGNRGPARGPAGNRGPAAGSRGPARGPAAGSRGPAAGSRGPAAGSRGPAAGSRGPAAGSRGPAAGSRGPSTPSRGPAAGSRGPSAPSRGPAAPSRGPSAGGRPGGTPGGNPGSGGRPGGTPGGNPGMGGRPGGTPGGNPGMGGRPGGNPGMGGRPGGTPGGGNPGMGGRPGGTPGGGRPGAAAPHPSAPAPPKKK